MKTLSIYCFVAIFLLPLYSCSSTDEHSVFDSIENNPVDQGVVLSLENGTIFKNTVDSINRLNYPYIKEGRTRSSKLGNVNDIILTDEEKVLLDKNKKILVEASFKMFESIGLPESEIKSIIGEGNEYAVVFAGLLAYCATHDNELLNSSTRAMTGNTYIDCALSALGLDLAAGLRTALEEGVSKKVAKQLIKSAVKASLGTSVGVSVTVLIWGLCVGGIG